MPPHQLTTLGCKDPLATAIAYILDALGGLGWDFANTTGLDWYYRGGLVSFDNVVNVVAAGYVTLADDDTSYVEVASNGAVSANTTGFTAGKWPVAIVTTASGTVTVYADKRTPWRGGGPSSFPATAITVSAGAFTGILSVSDTDVQTALGTIDQAFHWGSILSVNGAYKGITFYGTVDATGGVGSVLAQAADFHWDPADADAAATAHGLAMATGAGTGTERLLRYGMICNTAWNWSAGPVYLSNTAGEITQTAPVSGVVVPIGVALSADTIWFDPSQAEAMASSGLPASTGDGSLLYADGAGSWAEGFPMVNSEGLIMTNAQGLIVFGGM